MDSLISVPLVLFSLFLCVLICILFKVKLKTNHSKQLRFPPGPRPLPFIGNLHNLIGSPPHHAMRDLSRQYGPLMLLHLGETPTVVVSSPDAAREIMKTHDTNFASRPISTTMDIQTYGRKGLAFSPYGEYWRQIRKICALELFSTTRVQSFRSLREEEVGNLINSIYSSASQRQPVNLNKKLVSLVNDTTTRAIMGSRCKNKDVFLRELDTALKLAAGFNLADMFPSSWLTKLVSTAARKAERSRKARSQLFDEIIEQQREKKITTTEGEVENLLQVLLRSLEEDTLKNHVDRESVKPVIFDLFGGGTETSSTTIEWAMSELLRNPTAMKKAQSEVRELLKEATQISESHLDKLNYLRLVIKETLRMHPPLPLILPRQCHETCRIFDYDIAKGMTVLVNAWAMGRDPKYWDNPEEFRPERFFNSSTDFKGTNFEFIPFGAGRRICPGMTFGLVNVELPLASLLYHFDWELPDGLKPEQLDMSELFAITARRKTPLVLYAVPYKTNVHG